MKHQFSRLAAVLLTLCMLLVLVPAPATAGAADEAPRWNIMLVIDASDSLRSNPKTKANNDGSDPKGLRFEAVDSFIDSLQDDGHYVGAIVFTGNMTTSTTPEAMYTGIQLDTWKDGPIALDGNQNALKSQIRGVKVKRSSNVSAETDIGTALYYAEMRCREAEAQNGLPSAIFLFTDGEFKLNEEKAQKQAEKNLDSAITDINANQHVLCGVYLNAEGKGTNAATNEWYRNQVARANGIASNSSLLNDYFIEINNAADCFDSIDQLLQLLGYSIPDGVYIYDSADYSFRIPGIGVEEVTLRIRTKDGSGLPEGTYLAITDPNGKAYRADERSSALDSYRVYKITDPMAGTWNIHIEVPKQYDKKGNEIPNNVGIQYLPMFSMYVQCGFETSVPAASLHSNMTTDVTAYLELNGTRITDPAAYKEFDCVLTIENTVTGEKTEYVIAQDSLGNFILPITIDFYGFYSASIRFTCDELGTESTAVDWDFANRTPVAQGWEDTFNYGMMEETGYTRDISGLFSDVEDPVDTLLVEVVSAEGVNTDAITINGTEVSYDTNKIGSGTFVYRVTDSQGEYAEATVTIRSHSSTMRNIIILTVVIIIILVLILIRLLARKKPTGDCNLKFSLSAGASDNSGFGGTQSSFDITVAAPGRNSKRSTDLYSIIKADMNNSFGQIPNTCKQAHIDISVVQGFVASNAKQLKAVTLKCVEGRVGREKVAKIRIKVGKQKMDLYNNAMSFTIGGVSMMFAYYAQVGSFDDDGNGFVEGGGSTVWDNSATGASTGSWNWDAVPAEPFSTAGNSFGSEPAAPADESWGTAAADTDASSANAAPSDNSWGGSSDWGSSDWGSGSGNGFDL